jgi:hypothetical protein
MMTSIGMLALLLAGSVQMTAECKPGDQAGSVFKVVDRDGFSKLSSGPEPAPRNETGVRSNSATLPVRTAILLFGQKRYSLLLEPSDSEPKLSAGQSVCLHNQNGEARIMTRERIVLPGIAKPVPTIPANKRPDASARP